MHQHTNSPPAGRRSAMLVLAGLILTALLCWAGYWYIFLRDQLTTDNAYVNGNVVHISAGVAGTVVAIETEEADAVKQGQVLMRLDSTDLETQLAQTRAALADSVRATTSLFINVEQTQAGVRAQQAQRARSQAEFKRAQAGLAQARADFERREAAASQNLVSDEEYQRARMAVETSQALVEASRSAVAAADAAVGQAEAQVRLAMAQTSDTSVAEHPKVKQAFSAFRAAYVNATRAKLLAPVAGQVAKRTVQLGQRVAAAQSLMTVVPPEQMWVDANLKETELKRLRVGQAAVLNADALGSAVEYHGVVDSIAIGTGSAFSVLPAQNATGNWIKIVQRVPVRIRLDPAELRQHPLSVGMSMTVRVDTSQASSAAVLKRAPAVMATPIYDDLAREADGQALAIIRANSRFPLASPAMATASLTLQP